MKDYHHACLTDTQKVSVLLVEDDDIDALIFKSVAEMNKDYSIRITRARSLIEATMLVNASKYDLYIVDFRLGEGSSLRLLTSLAAQGANPVVVSNITPREAELYRLTRGKLRFLSKGDCSPSRIGALVREAIHERLAEAAA